MDSSKDFIEHLEELRRRIIISLAFILIFSVAAFGYAKDLIKLIVKPVGHLVFTSPAEVFVTYLKIALFAGIFLSAPVIIYHFWMFVSIALKDREKNYLLIFGPLSLMFFFTGAAFAFFIVIPLAIKFLMGFATDFITPMITISSYATFFGVLTLVFGAVFELPLAIMFLAKIGAVSPQYLSKKRRYAVLFIFIIAAVLTPPDVVSQVMMAFPLLVLYEIGILFAKAVYRKNPY